MSDTETAVPIEDSVAFTMLPLSAQALWFHLVVRAEWDGVQYRINKVYAREIREGIGASADDVRALMHNELIAELGEWIYLENVALYPGPVLVENGVKKIVHIFPGSRLEDSRQRISEYRRASVFDMENT